MNRRSGYIFWTLGIIFALKAPNNYAYFVALFLIGLGVTMAIDRSSNDRS